jgi:hypothetical protein
MDSETVRVQLEELEYLKNWSNVMILMSLTQVATLRQRLEGKKGNKQVGKA